MAARVGWADEGSPTSGINQPPLLGFVPLPNLQLALAPKRVAPKDAVPELNELQEIDNMLAERMDRWMEKATQEATQRAMQQGMQQGVLAGEARILGRVLERRFGALPEWVRGRIAAADVPQLEAWSERLLDVGSLEELFGPH